MEHLGGQPHHGGRKVAQQRHIPPEYAGTVAQERMSASVGIHCKSIMGNKGRSTATRADPGRAQEVVGKYAGMGIMRSRRVEQPMATVTDPQHASG